MLRSPFCICLRLRLLLSAVGVVVFPLSALAQTRETVAYCNSPIYAVNVYRDSARNPREMSLNMRVFWREKSLIIADSPAVRSQFYLEGFVYTSQTDDWMLFVPNNEAQSCLLFRDSAAVESGDVTRRQVE